MLIRAMQVVQQKLPYAELTIVGGGPLRQKLEAVAGKLGVRCKFTGAAPSALVRQLLRQAEVVCVPSQIAQNGDCEGLPIIALEAQSMGVPVVATTHAGLPEAIIHGQTGLLVAEGDVPALAENLLLLLENVSLRSAYGARAAQQVAERFDLELQTGRLEDIYEEVLGRAGLPDPITPFDSGRDRRSLHSASLRSG